MYNLGALICNKMIVLALVHLIVSHTTGYNWDLLLLKGAMYSAEIFLSPFWNYTIPINMENCKLEKSLLNCILETNINARLVWYFMIWKVNLTFHF